MRCSRGRGCCALGGFGGAFAGLSVFGAVTMTSSIGMAFGPWAGGCVWNGWREPLGEQGEEEQEEGKAPMIGADPIPDAAILFSIFTRPSDQAWVSTKNLHVFAPL